MRWIVRGDEGKVVGDILAKAGADPRALSDGRVFIGRRRVKHPTEPVAVGDVIEVASRKDEGPPIRILARDSDIVAVDKPAGIPTIADHGGAAHALVPRVAAALDVPVALVHATSRLDRDVSGVVVLALSKDAASRIASARAEGRYVRRYIAMAASSPSPPSGIWDAPIGRADDARLRRVAGRDATPATTGYAVCGTCPGGHVLLAVAPQTGRTHQIRVHAAHAGAALVGDRAYGGPARLRLPGGRVLEPRRIALHALRVAIAVGPGSPWVAESAVPEELAHVWAALGGDPAAWNVASTCALPFSSPLP